MKFAFPNLLRTAVPALVAGLLSPASAEQVVQAVQGDVLLAFRAATSSTTGAYLVNIGQASQLLGVAPGASIPVTGSGSSVVALAADLDTFDYYDEIEEELVPWHANKQAYWSAFSRNTAANNAVYISRPRPSLTQKSQSWGTRTGLAQNNASQQIGTVIGSGYNPLASTVGVSGSANNPRGGFQSPSLAGEPSYVWQVSAEGRQDFNTWTDTVEKGFAANFAPGGVVSALDFYVHRKGGSDSAQGTVTHVGYFTITTAGEVTFTRAGTDPFLTDTDGDGFSDGDEAVAGTNPNNGADFFRLPAPVVVPGVSSSFSLPTITGRTYVIEYNDDLAGPWQVLDTAAGTGSPWIYVDNDAARNELQRGFYRARVTNP